MADIPSNEGEGRVSPVENAAAEVAEGTVANVVAPAPSAAAMTASLMEFAAAAQAGAIPGGSDAPLTEELEAIVREVARTGTTNGFPWESLRRLLARKVELTLADHWRETQDVVLQEGDNFETTVVEPLTRSLLEPRREGAPFTLQRLCELLVEPKGIYKTTRKYLYAVQRAILITSTEEATIDAPAALDATVAPVMVGPAPEPAPAVVQGAPESRKRKLPEELSNGVVAE